MFPVQVVVGAQQRLLFDDNADTLARLGFDIAPFGIDTVVVNGVPEGFSCEPGKVERMVADIAVILSEERSSLQEIMQQSMAEKFAMLEASGSAPLGSAIEAQRLIDTLFASENAEMTSNGRRIVCILPTEELDKRF